MIRLVEQPTTRGTSLLEQYRASGSPEVFAQIMRAYGVMVFGVCMKVTRDAADAEDASQATFLSLAVQLKTGATINYLGPWLKKVAKRSSLDLVRSRKRRSRRETITASNRPDHYRISPSLESEQFELQEAIRAELDHLPAKYRMPLVLHYFGGMSHEEIGREMGCTTAALGVRLHRARKMLGNRLAARGITLQTTALGAAIAVAVNYYISERFIQTTTQAMLTMSVGRPMGMGAMALGSHIPVQLGIVPQLVQEVAQSMARTRMRYATMALAISITCLGGAAEAMRHLPESIRPNLDFLSPSKAIENLFSRPVVPRMQAPKPTPEAPVAVADTLPQSPIENYPPPAINVPLVAPSQHQPVLAFNAAPPVSSHTPHVRLQAPVTTTPPGQTSAAAKIVPRTSEPPQVLAKPAPITTFRAPPPAGTNVEESAPRVVPVQTASPMPDPDLRPVVQYIPPPAAIKSSSKNVDPAEKLQTLDSSPLTGEVAGLQGATLAGPTKLAFATLNGVQSNLESQYRDWLVLRTNDVYVHAGDGTYNWNDSGAGILPNCANSVAFSLEDVSGDGVMSIQKLANNTTLAPARPGGHTFIGIWSVESLMDYAGIDLQVRYDDTLASSLGLSEDVLKLWVYDGQWRRITDGSFARDLENHMLRGAWRNGSIDYFGVSAPEPTSILGLISMTAAALLRRRR